MADYLICAAAGILIIGLPLIWYLTEDDDDD